MKYEIRTPRALTRKAKTRIFLRWFCYAFVLIFLYSFMRSGIFGGIQPPFIIPWAIAVAMHEKEFSGSVFGLIGGLLLDLAVGGLFGFSGIWLMPACLLTAMLVTNLIRVNTLNHLWLSAITAVIMLLMDYLFRYMIWDQPGHRLVFTAYLLPAYVIAAFSSPLFYLLCKLIRKKLGEKEQSQLSAPEETVEEEEAK